MDKIDQLFDAMEYPEHYSAAEIEKMLQDPEVKEIFDLLDQTKSSLQTIVTPNIETEWTRFENNYRQSEKTRLHWLTRFFSRNAAASIAIGIASFTAMAAIIGVGIYTINKRSEITPEVEIKSDADIVVSQPEIVKVIEDKKGVTPEIIVFDEETLETIMNRLAPHYGYKVIFNNNAVKSLRLYFRWNQELSLEEIVESLNNFEQITLTINDQTVNID